MVGQHTMIVYFLRVFFYFVFIFGSENLFWQYLFVVKRVRTFQQQQQESIVFQQQQENIVLIRFILKNQSLINSEYQLNYYYERSKKYIFKKNMYKKLCICF
eukprot:TRINITY_DN8524_c0_g2_i2.p4 TRINITY_DN8524_c0_g2~~TRINITY_DN8524_c0_g2_i2.p4  ORF type:complete len:102 (+),score=2.40 TRINITY_DN8524_c0_g2_i2:884-1189(+)